MVKRTVRPRPGRAVMIECSVDSGDGRAGRWMQRVLAATVSVLAVGFFVVVTRTGSPVVAARKATTLPAGHALLLESLDERRLAWQPGERRQLLERTRGHRHVLLPALLWLLAQPAHPRFVEAAALAGELELREAAELLQPLAADGPPRVRPAAILALDRIEPIDAGELMSWLEASPTAVVAAALERLALRQELPVETIRAIARLLGHADAAVRAGAFAALPASLPSVLADDLERFLLDAEFQPLALQALVRVPRTPAVVEQLASALWQAAPEVQLTLLPALHGAAGNEPLTTQVWNLALASSSPEVRSSALHCLEASGVPADRLPAEVGEWAAPVRYAAARLLVRSGRMQGVRLLLDLAADPAAETQRAAAEARLLLAVIAGKTPHTGLRELEAWFAQQTDVPAAMLPGMPKL